MLTSGLHMHMNAYAPHVYTHTHTRERGGGGGEKQEQQKSDLERQKMVPRKGDAQNGVYGENSVDYVKNIILWHNLYVFSQNSSIELYPHPKPGEEIRR